MMPSNSTDLIEVLLELRRQYPAWRFGQLIANVAGWADQEVWDIEDEALLDAARAHLESAAKAEQEMNA